MRPMLLIVAIGGVVVWTAMAGPAAAVPPGCNDESTQFDLDVCADQDFKAADTDLNGTYAEIEKRLHEYHDGTKRLIATQKAWIGFRDAECDFQTFWSRDGSIYPMLVSECFTTMTKQRTEQLKVDLHCEDGDTMCPVPAP
jgi:uncharacterized protein YecT (DUF1311 family)